MNETQTRGEYIDPALKDAGWGTVEGSRILRRRDLALAELFKGGVKLTSPLPSRA